MFYAKLPTSEPTRMGNILHVDPYRKPHTHSSIYPSVSHACCPFTCVSGKVGEHKGLMVEKGV